MNKKVKGLPFDRVVNLATCKDSRVHFVGVGGVSMCSLARLTLSLGAGVSGSDREESERTRELSELGAKITVGHSANNVIGASLVVYSHAISQENPELLAAKNLGIVTISRAEYMGSLMIKYKNRIGVSGTHGKSTTVAMLDKIFCDALVLPSVLSGAALSDGKLMREGSDGVLIYEACEYKDSFLKFAPTIAVATSLELDHTDYFNNIDELKKSFTAALNRASGLAVVNFDDVNLAALIPELKVRTVCYGQSDGCDYKYRITAFENSSYRFSVERYCNTLGEFVLNIPGVFNVSNAVAAIVVALEYGIDIEKVSSAIAGFKGISRRLEFVGERYGRPVYYDYAHHPTEIRATIDTLKMLTGEEITVVFKPHTYSRTKSLWEGFYSSLSLADYVVLCEIYPAREKPIAGVTSSALAKEIGEKAVFLPDSEVVPYVDRHTRGAVVVMGAGEIDEIKSHLVG